MYGTLALYSQGIVTHELPFPAEFAAMAPALSRSMESSHLPAWDVMIRQAKQMGARVYVCLAMCEVIG